MVARGAAGGWFVWACDRKGDDDFGCCAFDLPATYIANLRRQELPEHLIQLALEVWHLPRDAGWKRQDVEIILPHQASATRETRAAMGRKAAIEKREPKIIMGGKKRAAQVSAGLFGVIIVEDDIFADFEHTPAPRLAAFDGLNRVIHIGSFSKSLSASVRWSRPVSLLARAPTKFTPSS